MSLGRSKCLHSNNCLHFLKWAFPGQKFKSNKDQSTLRQLELWRRVKCEIILNKASQDTKISAFSVFKCLLQKEWKWNRRKKLFLKLFSFTVHFTILWVIRLRWSWHAWSQFNTDLLTFWNRVYIHEGIGKMPWWLKVRLRVKGEINEALSPNRWQYQCQVKAVVV